METPIVETAPQKTTPPYFIQKGQVLNPKGRGKGNLSMTTMLRSMLEKMATGESLTPKEKILMSTIRQAETGNLTAVQMIWERLEGKPVQMNQNLNVDVSVPLKDDQKKSLLKLLNG